MDNHEEEKESLIAQSNLTGGLERETARNAFYKGADRGEPLSWRDIGPDEVWNAAWNAAALMCENLCDAADFNGKGANYCANQIRHKRSNE
jgi:hypothetical protein